jgi:nitric oxide dioxygenase
MAALAPGDTVRAFKVSGEFIVDANTDTEIVFLSGGIGITPVRSIIKDLQFTGARVSWRLLHVASSEFLYQDEFDKIKAPQWRVHRNQIDGVWDQIIVKAADIKYYVSGSERFVLGMKEKLGQSGIAPRQINTESFLS